MKAMHRRCAGLDVHQKEIVACRRIVARKKVQTEVRRFETTTQGLLALADWLEEGKVTHVAMEATGVYWKPVWHILEGRFTLILANAAHIKGVPGRKSDVNDAIWIADLDRRSAGARPDPRQFRAAAADPGAARLDADEEAVGPGKSRSPHTRGRHGALHQFYTERRFSGRHRPNGRRWLKGTPKAISTSASQPRAGARA